MGAPGQACVGDKEVELITLSQLSSGLGLDGRRKWAGEALLSWTSHSPRSGHGQ